MGQKYVINENGEIIRGDYFFTNVKDQKPQPLNCSRSAWVMFLLNIVTLGIYGTVITFAMGKESNITWFVNRYAWHLCNSMGDLLDEKRIGFSESSQGTGYHYGRWLCTAGNHQCDIAKRRHCCDAERLSSDAGRMVAFLPDDGIGHQEAQPCERNLQP